jgi:GAF domain-containing protein
MRGEFQKIAQELEAKAHLLDSATALMERIVRTLHGRLHHFNWVGFYLISKDDSNVLELGPFAGAPTPHTRIPLDQGICGAAASTGETLVIDDVNSDPRYLACSLETKSEIVVPIFVNGRVAGELDIDSRTPAAFTSDDRELVEHCAKLAGRRLASQAA